MTLKTGSILEKNSKRSRAKAELSILAQALENYRERYGDYPWVESENGANELYQALTGNRSPVDGYYYHESSFKKGTDPLPKQRSEGFIMLSHFSLQNDPDSALQTSDANANNAFVDPWGSPYSYQYKKINSKTLPENGWQRFGYLLMSHGPDKDTSLQIPSTGVLGGFFKDPRSADNIFSE